MKILQIITSIDLSSGGPSKIIIDQSLILAQKGVKVIVITKETPNPYILNNGNKNFEIRFIKHESFNKSVAAYIKKEKFDILEINGIWEYSLHYFVTIARKKNIPYIITTHGMLEPWSLNAGKLKKQLALWFYQSRDLKKASCIHATANKEARNIQQLGFKKPIAIIPYCIDLSDFSMIDSKPKKRIRKILFLSRIHPKKGIELLIQAWSMLDVTLREKWQINIAGNGEAPYINSLQELISKNNLNDQVHIIGSQFGVDKIRTYQDADLFVLPTFSENFGIVIPEALACGLPVITTKGTPWEELNTKKAGWWIDIGVEPLIQALQNALQLSDSDREQMGANGRRLVEENYSIESVADKMIQFYKWILDKTKKPEFVQLD